MPTSGEMLNAIVNNKRQKRTNENGYHKMKWNQNHKDFSQPRRSTACHSDEGPPLFLVFFFFGLVLVWLALDAQARCWRFRRRLGGVAVR